MEVPPSTEAMQARRAAVLDLGLPYLVAELEGVVVGYTYASAYRARPAYRHTIENSVYLAEGFGGRGVGTALLTALIERCQAGPWAKAAPPPRPGKANVRRRLQATVPVLG
jgi:phosphinothricin acetyltransferase